MDYNYSNPQGELKRKIDVKGLILTIVCLVTSIMVTLSTLMPIISFGTDYATKSFNIITVFKLAIGWIEQLSIMSPYDDIVLGMIVSAIAILIPIAIMLYGIIETIVMAVKLVTMRYVQKVNGYAWTVLVLEMLISVFMYVYIYAMVALLGLDDDYAVSIGLSVGWYLPVILCLCVMFLGYSFELNKVREVAGNRNLLAQIFGTVGAVIASLMYISFAFPYFKLTQMDEVLYLPFSYINISVIGNLYYVFICIFVITIAILSHICLTRNLKKAKKGKFGAVFNIVVGALAILFTIISYVLLNTYYDERINFYELLHGNSNKYITSSMGAASYMYIIMGSLLLILGIIYLCVNGLRNNRQNIQQ